MGTRTIVCLSVVVIFSFQCTHSVDAQGVDVLLQNFGKRLVVEPGHQPEVIAFWQELLNVQ